MKLNEYLNEAVEDNGFENDNFWINLLGFCALYNKDKKNPLLTMYLKKINKKEIKEDDPEIDDALDNSNELTTSIKKMIEKDNLRTVVVTELIKFLLKLKRKQIETIDDEMLREILRKVLIAKIPPNPMIKQTIKNFIKGEISLDDTLEPLFKYSRKNKINLEFVKIAKRIMNKGE
jgi:hypothetical protein